MQRRILLPLCMILAPVFGCAAERPVPVHHYESKPDKQLRTPEEVARTLDRAQAAYLEGNWGDTVVLANRVMEGAASADEYYLAVKLLGLAACNRRDPAPVSFSWRRLRVEDQQALRRQCEQHGLTISDQGAVVRQGRPAPEAPHR